MSFSYTPPACFSEEFLLHSSSLFQWVVSPTPLKLGLVNGFRYTSDTSFSEEFLLRSSAQLCLVRLSLTVPTLVLVKSFSYTPHVAFSEHFLLHSWL